MTPATQLNYHHLRYFWMVAREGGLRQAAEKLHVSQPSLSAQIRELEAAIGERLFQRQGRGNVLTDAGQIALRYADEIFTLGSELSTIIRQSPTARAIRLYVGVTDTVPKLVAHRLLSPAFSMEQRVQVICREGKPSDLIAHLTAHRLDLVLSDEPASSGHQGRVFNHLLGETGVLVCAAPKLAERLKKDFPRSLHGAPALLPSETTALRRSVEEWFQAHKVKPDVLGEFEDTALLMVAAAEGRGFVIVPAIVRDEASERYGLVPVGKTRCKDQMYAITAKRRIFHPAVERITEQAKTLFST